MMDPSNEPARATRWFGRSVFAFLLASIAVLLLYTAWVAISSAFANDDFPESLAVKVELLPLIFPIHMVAGGLALVLLPLAIALRRQSRWHRPIGRIAAVDVLVAGITAFPVAWIAPVTFWSAAGFSAQAAIWLTLLVMGVHNIRRRRIAAHRTCMILMTATAMGAVFFRLYLALFAMWGPSRWFDAFYAFDSWVAWLLPLGIAALIIARRRDRRVMSRRAKIVSNLL
jgi:uncharacterized membrane protein YozB (DUF420 family)